MSRPRYDWWGYVKGMIRRYPALCRQYWDLHSQSVTALYGPQGGAGDDARKTERMAIRELPATKQREYEAVRLAVRADAAAAERRRAAARDRSGSLEEPVHTLRRGTGGSC